jgi:3-phenylpropionate/cinnamic acid dioxygenase small subunit
MSELAPIKLLLIERACEQLSIEYARSVDFRDYDNFIELFTDDAVLDVGKRLEGKEAIRSSINQRAADIRTRHVLTNIFVEVLDSMHARGISYLTLYRHIGIESTRRGAVPSILPTAVGHYEDKFVRTSEGWRFASRILHVAFRDPPTLKNDP